MSFNLSSIQLGNLLGESIKNSQDYKQDMAETGDINFITFAPLETINVTGSAFVYTYTLTSSSVGGSTLVDGYSIDDNAADSITSTIFMGQTFTTSGAYTINSVRLKLYKATTPGTLTVGIRATSAGVPTGANLTSGTIDANTFTTNTAGEWYTINLTPYTLAPSTQYAIVLSSAASAVYWREDTTSPAYTGGSYVVYFSGAWTAFSTKDFMFEIYSGTGSPVTMYPFYLDHPNILYNNLDSSTIYLDGDFRTTALHSSTLL